MGVLAARIGFTVVVLALVVWLLATGKPLGGLLIIPLVAIWLRRAAERGKLGRRTEPRPATRPGP
jgi:hypothetical protein